MLAFQLTSFPIFYRTIFTPHLGLEVYFIVVCYFSLQIRYITRIDMNSWKNTAISQYLYE